MTDPHVAIHGRLVDREAERAELDGWIERVVEGRPTIGTVRGQPGVGKSLFLDAAAETVQAHGALVLRARGTSDAPPLLPMLTALGPLVDQAEQGRRPDLGPDDVTAISTLVHAAPITGGDLLGRRRSDDTRRYLAATRLLLGAASTRPIALVVDDAHLLDGASASLLAHLAGGAAHSATTRPVHLLTLLGARTEAAVGPTRRALMRLRDEPGSAELHLAGLEEIDLNSVLVALGPAPPDRPLLRDLHRQTGGNPLYARFLWHHLVDTGAARVVGGKVRLVDPRATDLGHITIDEALDEQVDSLPAECRQVLEVAASLGDEAEVGVLVAATGKDVDRVDALLATAEDFGIGRMYGDRFRFDHPLRRAALSRGMSTTRRQRLHLRLAEALTATRPPPALEIATHLRSAGTLAPASERRRWGVTAAGAALDRGAWGDAVAGFTLALDDGAGAGFDTAERAQVLARAAVAAAADHDLSGCEHFAAGAVTAARAVDDLATWSTAVLALGHARIRATAGGRRSDTRDLEEFIAAATSHERWSTDRQLVGWSASAHALLAEASFVAFDFDAGLAHSRRARELATAAGDREVMATAAFAEGLHHQARFELDASDACLAEAAGADTDAEAPAAAWARARLPSAYWLRGDLTAAVDAARAAERDASTRLDWAELSLLAAWRAAIAGGAGAFAEAEELAEEALRLHRRSDYAFAVVVALPTLAVARASRGLTNEAHGALDQWRHALNDRWIDRLHVLVDAIGGDDQAVVEAVNRRPWPTAGDPPTDLRWAATTMAQVEVAASAGRATMAATARPALVWLHERGAMFVPGSLSLVARLVAVSAAAAGDHDGEARWLARARADARRAGAEAELARCDLDEAARALAAGESSGRVDHLLTGAATAFDRLDMVPFLRRAETLLGTAGAGRRATRVILFTDLVDSTALNAVAGDDAYDALLRDHDRIARDLLARHDGVEFKHTGDGLAAWFASPRRAVTCALDLRDGLAHLRTDLRRVEVRCGLSAGDPIERGGDLFGIAVTRAARVCAIAEPGEVLLSAEVGRFLDGAAVDLTHRGSRLLKGIPDPVDVLAARRDALAPRP